MFGASQRLISLLITLLLAAAFAAGCSTAGPSATPKPSDPTISSSTAATRALPSAVPQASAIASEAVGSPASTPTVGQQPTPDLPPFPEAGTSWTSPVDGTDLVFIPADEFRMGTLPEYVAGQPDEKPQRTVFLESYWIDKTEVTWDMYTQCEEDGACNPHSQARPEWAAGDHPVTMVTWGEAEQYCRWAGRRLPTEAEWEMAARGTDGRRYPWEWIGAPESRGQLRLNFCDLSCPFPFASPVLNDGYPYTAPVGSFPAGASPFGVLDMAGNVWEWTADWYQADRYLDETVDLAQGPNSGTVRAIRGGSWLETAWDGIVITSRAANRGWHDPASGRPDLGFRCVLSTQPPTSDG